MRLKCLEQRCNDDVCRQRVPYFDGCREERLPMCEYGRGWRIVLRWWRRACSSCSSEDQLQLGYHWGRNVHHRRSFVAPSFVPNWAPHRSQHGCDARVPAVLPGDKTDCASLDLRAGRRSIVFRRPSSSRSCCVLLRKASASLPLWHVGADVLVPG